MLGSGIMLVGLFVAISSSVNAFRAATDRPFAVAALVVAAAEILLLVLAAVVPAVLQT
jgi:hypothetical protein